MSLGLRGLQDAFASLLGLPVGAPRDDLRLLVGVLGLVQLVRAVQRTRVGPTTALLRGGRLGGEQLRDTFDVLCVRDVR